MEYNKTYTVFKGQDREFTGTMKQIAEHNGITVECLRQRMKANSINIEQAIDYKKKIRQPKRYIVFKGTPKEFEGTMQEIAEHFNTKYNLIHDRKKSHGLTLEESLEYDNFINKVYKINIDSEEFKGNIKEIGKRIRINHNLIMARLRMGEDIKEAIDLNENEHKYKVKKFGKTVELNIKEISDFTNIRENYIKTYLNKGYKIEDIIRERKEVMNKI